MTEPTELMPCPFCGGNARKVKHSAGSPGTIGYDRWHGVACAGCNACVGARDRRFRTSAAAIAAWNTRTPQPTQAQVGAVPLDEARRLFDAGWRAAALFCDREDVVADGIIGFGACPQFEAAFSAAHGIKGGQHGTE